MPSLYRPSTDGLYLRYIYVTTYPCNSINLHASPSPADRHATAAVEEREKEEVIFKEVSEAYQVLSDPQKKSRYDSGQDLEEHVSIRPVVLYVSVLASSYQELDGGHRGSVMTGESNLNTTITGLIAGATYSISVAANSSTLPSYPTSATFTLRKCVS